MSDMTPDEEARFDASQRQSAFWMRMAAFGFSAWSIMIPIGVMMVRSSVDALLEADKEFSRRFEAYVLTMERRVTTIEERQAIVLRSLQQLNERTERLSETRNHRDNK
jgi:hypothetical protein